jgi:hypothetical protein
MRRKLTILAILLALGGVGAGVWRALHPPVTPFLAHDAQDIQVVEVAAGMQLITYRAPGARYDWRSEVAHNLLQAGWVNPPWWHPDLPELSYARRSEFCFGGALWEQVDIGGEPNSARITVRRWIELPGWLERLWHVIAGAARAPQR